MISINDALLFTFGTLLMALTPGPNMIYLISRSITQGRLAGTISLVGVACGFLFHIAMVSFGLTAIFFAIPYAYAAVKFVGAGYLLYLAFKAVGSKEKGLVAIDNNLAEDSPLKLFNMGFITNVLNPKVAFFALSFFPQFIKPEQGSILGQSITLGLIQITISFTVNYIIIAFAARIASWFSVNPRWLKAQRWFMASVLTGLAVKMAITKAE